MNTQQEQDHERITELLQELSRIGEKHYKPEYRTGGINYAAIGLAIGEVTDNTLEVARIAYAALEDWNFHSACAVLDWIFPKLHPMDPESPAREYLDTLQRVQRIISREPVTVFTQWNNDKRGYDTASYKVVVTLEKTEQE